MSIDDGIALTGLLILLSGIFLWLGLAATLIVLGLVMIYIGMRVEFPQRVKQNEPDKTINS
jgi:hypothetical protein